MKVDMDDVSLAAKLAQTAGELLVMLQMSGLFDGKALGNAGDRVANGFLMEALKALRPDDGVLSEEEGADSARLAKSRVWIIDPLDGTREYGEHRTDWAVHVALAVDGRPVIGAVALPGRGLVLRSDTARAKADRPARPRMLVSRTRPPVEAERIAELLGADLVPMGSAGAKAMAVVLDEGDIYLHAGGQFEWDNCAPAAVALGAGLHASRIDGSPLMYNCSDPKLPDLLICTRDLAPTVLDAVARSA